MRATTVFELMTGRGGVTRPVRYILEDAKNRDVEVRLAVAEYAPLSKGYFTMLANDTDWAVRLTLARRADTPRPVINKLAADSHPWVRRAVEERKALPARTFEPPAEVYKKTSGGIITASIPVGALVRGGPGGKCRASAARITSGHGASLALPGLVYAEGEDITLPFFNMAADPASGAGFYFWCSRAAAEAFEL
jgi:hypothetical protein